MGPDSRCVSKTLQREVRQSPDRCSKRDQPKPILETEGKPPEERIGDGQFMEVVGEGFADKSRYGLHIEFYQTRDCTT